MKILSIININIYNLFFIQKFDINQNVIVLCYFFKSPDLFMPSPDMHDQTVWTLNTSGIFTTKSAMNSLRSQGPAVYWYKLAWCKNHVPRFALILWLANK